MVGKGIIGRKAQPAQAAEMSDITQNIEAWENHRPRHAIIVQLWLAVAGFVREAWMRTPRDSVSV